MSKDVKEACKEIDNEIAHREEVKNKILKLIAIEYEHKKDEITISFVKHLLNQVIQELDYQPFRID